jgi:glutathione S-transferase
MDILYDSKFSGNGWKVRLLLSFLGRPYERRVLDLAQGQARSAEFLALNPMARVPLLVLDDGAVVRESNAILFFLARDTPWLPSTPAAQAAVLQWLFFEQFDHLRYFARPRFLVSIARTADKFQEEIVYLRQIGEKALAALECRLAAAPFLAGDRCTIADLALFPYTSMAEMGGYSLAPFPAVTSWIDRVRALPGFIPLLTSEG